MGIFDIFRKNKSSKDSSNFVPRTLGQMLEGPTFLEGYTTAASQKGNLEPFEWKRKLQSPSGGDKFRVKYYGDLFKDLSGLLVGTDFAPLLVIAVDVETGKEILLFDGCRHGYNAMFCDTYTDDQRNNRITEKFYRDERNNEVFEITLSAYYQMSEDEFWDIVDKNGNVELLDGTVVKYDVAWRNCYDFFQVCVINEANETIEIVSEELA